MFSIIQAAGWPVWFLILASILAVALIIERALSLQRGKVLPDHLLDEVLTLHRNRQTTSEMVQKLEANSPLGRVFASGLRHALDGREMMKEAMVVNMLPQGQGSLTSANSPYRRAAPLA